MVHVMSAEILKMNDVTDVAFRLASPVGRLVVVVCFSHGTDAQQCRTVDVSQRRWWSWKIGTDEKQRSYSE